MEVSKKEKTLKYNWKRRRAKEANKNFTIRKTTEDLNQKKVHIQDKERGLA